MQYIIKHNSLNILTCFMMIALILMSFQVKNANKWYTKNGHIDFYSHTPVEDIKANNENVVSVLEPASAKIEFKVSINSFVFDKKLMQEHFKENYMESKLYPEAKFSGIISNNSDVKYDKPGSYSVTAKGKLTIHGQTNEVTVSGNIKIETNSIELTSKFQVNPEDYKIKIPSAVKEKVAKSINVNISCKYQSF